MPQEIEHKYLVVNDQYKTLATKYYDIVQGYIDKNPQHTIRIRRKGDKCYLTIKGITRNDTRPEFEYEIPEKDFESMLPMCEGLIIQKRRYIVPYSGFTWEVDVFGGALSPLIIAEIELPYSHYDYKLPPFVGKEVTDDPRYYNSNLAASADSASEL